MAHQISESPPPVPIAQCGTLRNLRELLELAADARREGDTGPADLLEQDALVVLRAGLQAARLQVRE
jgi:hypothetical protein